MGYAGDCVRCDAAMISYAALDWQWRSSLRLTDTIVVPVEYLGSIGRPELRK